MCFLARHLKSFFQYFAGLYGTFSMCSFGSHLRIFHHILWIWIKSTSIERCIEFENEFCCYFQLFNALMYKVLCYELLFLNFINSVFLIQKSF